jgi:signal transduction histidine kinase
VGRRPSHRSGKFWEFPLDSEWPPELLERLVFAVRLFGGAIERKQSEIALQAARTELRIASRRNMMSQIVASLAHEVNQPLGAILSNAQAARRFLATKRPNLEDLWVRPLTRHPCDRDSLAALTNF